MILYKSELGEGTYGFSYEGLKQDYYKYRSMCDDDFLANLVDVLHFTVFICFVKETGNNALSDEGIVHELVHLLDPKIKNLGDLPRIRELFNKVCELV